MKAHAVALALAGTLMFVACGASNRAPEGTFTLAAAASLTDVIGEALERWNADPKRVPGRATFGASSTLARQIEAGAPYELFLSANREWVDHLVAAGIGNRAPEPLAMNRLAIIAPQRTSEALFEADAIQWPMVNSTERWDYRHLVGRRWTTADPDHVPLGRAARAHLEANGWWEALSPNLVATKDARAALRLVERGEVEWGIVYATDADSSDRIDSRGHRSTGYEPLQVTGLVVQENSKGAAEFLAWLAGPAGQDLWRDHGFAPITGR